MADIQTTQADVTVPVQGTTTFGAQGLSNPTPKWAVLLVRTLTWVTAIWSFLSIMIDFTDFGISEHAAVIIIKYAAAFTGLISVLARFLGVKPPELNAAS